MLVQQPKKYRRSRLINKKTSNLTQLRAIHTLIAGVDIVKKPLWARILPAMKAGGSKYNMEANLDGMRSRSSIAALQAKDQKAKGIQGAGTSSGLLRICYFLAGHDFFGD